MSAKPMSVPRINNEAPVEPRGLELPVLCGDCYLERPIAHKFEDRGVCLNCYMRTVDDAPLACPCGRITKHGEMCAECAQLAAEWVGETA